MDLYDMVIELSNVFPEHKNKFIDVFADFVFGSITGKNYEQLTKTMCLDRVKFYLSSIKQEVKDKSKNYINAYYDVARYQTNPIDAATEWNVDLYVLYLLLDNKPPPSTPEGRHALSVPVEVIRRREIL